MKLQGKKLRITLIGIIVAAFSLSGFAQDSGNSLLWKLEGNGIKKPSYVYGTIHVICQEDLQISDPLKEAITNADKIYMELDMDDPNLMVSMQQKMLNPGMANISADISEADKTKLNSFFTKHYGVGLDQLGIMKPIGLYAMMAAKFVECTQVGSYEGSIIEIGKANEIEVKGLETVDFQVNLFDKIPQKELIKWLVEATDLESSRADFDKMIQAYKKNDLNGLYTIMAETSPEFLEYEDLLLTDRNKNWIPSIKEASANESIFIAVGAGHLAGAEGVIALLKKEGYTLTPVKI